MIDSTPASLVIPRSRPVYPQTVSRPVSVAYLQAAIRPVSVARGAVISPSVSYFSTTSKNFGSLVTEDINDDLSEAEVEPCKDVEILKRVSIKTFDTYTIQK